MKGKQGGYLSVMQMTLLVQRMAFETWRNTSSQVCAIHNIIASDITPF